LVVPRSFVQEKVWRTPFLCGLQKPNDVTKEDCFPLPRIYETLDTLTGENGFPLSNLRAATGKSMYTRMTRRRQLIRQVKLYGILPSCTLASETHQRIWEANGNSPTKSHIRRMSREPEQRDYDWPYILRAPP
jgi:hypothetical protein